MKEEKVTIYESNNKKNNIPENILNKKSTNLNEEKLSKRIPYLLT